MNKSISSADNSLFREPSRFHVNTQHFSPDDLALFVDSMETILRFKRLRAQKQPQSRPRSFLQSTPCSFSPTISNSSALNSPNSGDCMPIYDIPKCLRPIDKVITSNCVTINEIGDSLTTTTFNPGCNIDDCYFSASNNGSNQSSPRNGILIQEPHQSFLTPKLDAFDATQSSTDTKESAMFLIHEGYMEAD